MRKEVFVTGVQLEIAETFNSFNATLLHSQAEFFFFLNFFLVWKHNIVYSKTLLQDKKTFSVFMIASDPTPPLDKYFVPTDSPGLAPTPPLIRHFALSEKLVLGEV